jgi:hypothetical protein
MKAFKRIGRLEEIAPVKNCRRQSFFVGGGSKDADVHEFLKSIGYDVQPTDFVIHFIGVGDDAGPLVDLTGAYGRGASSRHVDGGCWSAIPDSYGCCLGLLASSLLATNNQAPSGPT